MKWADCSSFLSSERPGEVEFSIFEKIDDAVAYIDPSDTSVPVLLPIPTDSSRGGTPRTPDLDQNLTMEPVSAHRPKQHPSESSAAAVPLNPSNAASSLRTAPAVSILEKYPAKKRKRSLDTLARSDTKPSRSWATMFGRLKAYKEQHGDLNVPDDDESYKELYRWIGSQRKAYRTLKRDATCTDGFMDEKITRLLELGFDFQYVSWDCHFKQLEAFQSSHDTGSSNFEEILLESDPGLHQWWKQQRSQYRCHCSGKPSTLTSSQVHQLQRLGALPLGNASKMDAEFDEMLQELLHHKKTHGHCNVSSLDKANAPLARWVNKQRLQYRKLKDGKFSHLTAQRMARLTEIGFVFCPKGKSPSWDDRLALLREKYALDGHLRYPKSEQAMRSWITRIRKEYQRYQQGQTSLLTQEKIEQLNELGMVWVTGFTSGIAQAPRKTWNERFEDLKEFIRQHGHSIVPQLTPGLGEWVHTQRVEYKKMQKGKKSVLTAERALQLVEIGFCFDAMQQRGKSADFVDYRQPM